MVRIGDWQYAPAIILSGMKAYPPGSYRLGGAGFEYQVMNSTARKKY